MRKRTILTLALIAGFVPAFAQPSRWFVSVESGYPFGGPLRSIKKNMKRSGLDKASTTSGFGWWGGASGSVVTYPKGSQKAPLLVKAGKHISRNRSFFITAGISNAGTAQGYTYHMMDTAINYSIGHLLDLEFQVLQLTGSLQYSFTRTRAKVAVGPSLFLFRYHTRQGMLAEKRYAAFVPGVAASARLPLGKEKKVIGIDLVAELNAALPVKMKQLSSGYQFNNERITATLKSGTVNMIHGMMGLAFSFRR